MKETRRIEFIFEVLRILGALAIAYALSLVAIALISDSPGEAIYMFAVGPFTSMRRFGQLVGRFIPYLLTGTGMCFVYASNRFNLIGEGTYLISGCLVAYAAINFGSTGPHILVLLGLFVLALLVGGGFGMVPAVLREKLGVNEVVVSIMMNYALLFLATYLVKTQMRDNNITYMASTLFSENAKLGTIIQNTQIHTGLFVGLLAVVVTSLIFYKTPLGYAIRISGSNPDFAKAAGINITQAMIIAQVLGAALAGLGGAVDMLGIYDRYMWTALTNMGFDGLLVAVLSKKNPLFVPLGAFLLAYLRTGASILNYTTEIPIEFVQIVQAIIILLIAAEQFMGGYKRKLIFRSAKRKEEKELAAS
ncbi:MAG: ABC transporter permease [Anaerolineaceae bacterium]|nr:ABC transporter permease [Anaerolineaceae bacterium]